MYKRVFIVFTSLSGQLAELSDFNLFTHNTGIVVRF